jgi:hypothetical protein
MAGRVDFGVHRATNCCRRQIPAAMEQAMNPHQHQTRPLLFVAVVFAAMASGCGARLESLSPKSAECPEAGDPLTGRWIGTWQSFDQGSKRSVQAEFVPCGDGQFRARYVVPIGGVIPCTHELTHATSRRGSAIWFSGTMSRDALLKAGTRFDASSDGVTLVINYQSARDFGVIRLHLADSARKPSMAEFLAAAIRKPGG